MTKIREFTEARTAAGHIVIEFRGGVVASSRQFARPARQALFKTQDEYGRLARDAMLSRVQEVIRRPVLTAPRAGF